MSAGSAPFIYRNPVAYNRIWPEKNYHDMPEFPTVYGTFCGSTDQDWRTLKILLAGINQLHGAENHSDVGAVARVEFFWYKEVSDPHNRNRGAVVFDNYGNLLLHAPNALLGYGGSGPWLSEQILRAVGVSKEMFNDANGDVWGKDYTLIFSRQYHDTATGVDLAVPYGPVRREWEWWTSYKR